MTTLVNLRTSSRFGQTTLANSFLTSEKKVITCFTLEIITKKDKNAKMQLPNFSFERKLWQRGYRIIAGVDEVGRGALAGPVVAGCVAFAPITNYQFSIFNQFSKKLIINDSKKLTAKQRERADRWIKRNALAWGIGEASVAQINKFGIKKATEIAFRRAIKNCKVKIDYLLIDAFFIPYVRGLRRKKQTAIINGDEKSLSIAAASIIAKVYRDRLMQKLQNSKIQKLQVYGWSKNKGYGTKEHQDAIKKYGTTRYHRKLFVRKLVSSQAQ